MRTQNSPENGGHQSWIIQGTSVAIPKMRDPKVVVLMFVAAGGSALLPIQNIQVQLVLGWDLVLLAFPL